MLPRQLAHSTYGHQLDEPDVYSLLQCKARKILDLIVVDTSHHNDVHLYGTESGGERQPDGFKRSEIEATSRDRPNAIGAQRVGADVDAVEARLAIRPDEFCEPHSVGRQRDVVDARNTSELTYQNLEVWTESRLSPCEPKPLETERRKLAHNGGYFLVIENLRAREPRQPLERHAVQTSEIALVGNGDAEILDPSTELVSCALGRAHVAVTRVGSTHDWVPSA